MVSVWIRMKSYVFTCFGFTRGCCGPRYPPSYQLIWLDFIEVREGGAILYHHWRQGCLPEDASLPKRILAVVGIHPRSWTARPLKNGGWKTTFLLEDLVSLRKSGLLVQSRPWTMDMLFPILKVSYQIYFAFILSEQTKIAVALLGSTSTLQLYLWLNVCWGHVYLRQRNRLTSQHNPKVLMTLFLLGWPCSLL